MLEIDIIQIMSIVGAFLCLIPFASVQLNLLSSKSLAYSVLNFTGSSILTTVAVIQSEYGFILMESVWAIVSLYGISQVIVRYKSIDPS